MEAINVPETPEIPEAQETPVHLVHQEHDVYEHQSICTFDGFTLKTLMDKHKKRCELVKDQVQKTIPLDPIDV